MKTTSPMKKKKKKACVLHLSHNDSFGDSLCARDKDTLTLSSSVTEAIPMVAGEESLQQSGLLLLC